MWLRRETLFLATALLEVIFQPERACSPHLTDKPLVVEKEKVGLAHFPGKFWYSQVKGSFLHLVLCHQGCGSLF